METERELFLHYWTDNNLPYDGDDDDMEVAWTAWQAKIDDLQKLRSLDEMAINQLAQANQVWQIKCDELQGRIDEAMDYITESGGVNLTSKIALNHILKGNKDEN